MIKTNINLEEMTQKEAIEYVNETVRPESGAIPAYLLGDPTIYDIEHKKVFLKTWLFIGHESEIPAKNDFITRDVAGYSVIISRGSDNVIRGLYNMCTHRGMKLCRADAGNKSLFTCPYHGFNFKNNGDCVGVPLQKDIYGEDFDKSDLGLHQVRIETYKGFIFGTWNEIAEPLEDFLGEFKWYIDIFAGRAEMQVMGPAATFYYSFKLENRSG
ncbi:Rieske 2Fe-2S domain-containing protein [Neobacillus pocheonensis]|uniref:Rieske 2Fe-2S domain-containing protein n=1 Tax=Neobacillus pocheonensis TaxID=363869 RepID=A0ABT0W470_9BACI|nr:Rieske 2Fe-2S domain-containing protein [Neobacillus pocheonensis]